MRLDHLLSREKGMDGEFIHILGRGGKRKQEGESRRAEADRESRKDRRELGKQWKTLKNQWRKGESKDCKTEKKPAKRKRAGTDVNSSLYRFEGSLKRETSKEMDEVKGRTRRETAGKRRAWGAVYGGRTHLENCTGRKKPKEKLKGSAEE